MIVHLLFYKIQEPYQYPQFVQRNNQLFDQHNYKFVENQLQDYLVLHGEHKVCLPSIFQASYIYQDL